MLVVVPALLALSCASAGTNREAPSRAPAPNEDALALVAQAQLRLQAGEIAEGLRLFRRALSAAPDDQELIEEYGLALASVGVNDQAIEQLQRVERPSPEGEATLGLLLAQNATDAAALERAIKHLEKGVTDTPEGYQARLTLVQAQLRLGRGQQAWEAVKPAIDDRPDDGRLRLLAGQALRLAGRNQEAIEHLRAAAAAPETAQRATLELIEALAADGELREAADAMGEFLSGQGATLAGLTRWATLLARAGDTDKAKAVVDEVLGKDPAFRDALLLRALLLTSEGDMEAAERTYRKALEVEPTDIDARLGLARLFGEQHRADEARELLLALLKDAEQAKRPVPELLAEITQELATLELQERRPEAARPWLDRLPRPLDRRSVALWGEFYRQREAWTEGLQWLESAELAEDDAAGRLRQGLEVELRLRSGDEAGGKAALDRLLAGSKEQVLTAVGVMERLRRYPEMLAGVRSALDRLGDDAELKFTLAAGLERSGQWDAAVAAFRALLEEEPDNAATLNYLGYMFADKGVNLGEARTLIEKAVKRQPRSGAYLDSLGWVHFRLGNTEEAERYLTEAARLEPFDPTVHEHLGDLYRSRGENAKAVESYRRALAGDEPELGQAERIEGKLAALAAGPSR